MNKSEYLLELKTDIDNLLLDYKLMNYKNQSFAWKLNATFNRTFDENFLWNQSMFLSTNSCFLLQDNLNEKSGLNGLHESAEIYEYLSELPEISEKFDKDYLSILSALCYDLSGYQANAYCVAKRIKDYNFETDDERIDLTTDNIVIEQIRLILLKNIPLAMHKLNTYQVTNDLGYDFLKRALNNWYAYILKLKDSNYDADIDNAYFYFLNTGNAYLSHLIFLLKTRILLFDKRGLWNNLKKNDFVKNDFFWKKYIKLLAYDYYSKSSIKHIDERQSIFEFWTSQLRAIEQGLIELDDNYVVQMPTSAGKTFIAELFILKYLTRYPDKKCIYIAPFRALTSEKEVELSKYFSKLGFSVSALAGSYEIDDFQDVIISETDVLIATPEKIDLFLRLNPDFFDKVSAVVVDEGHIIGDISSRASLLEFLIIRLKIKIAELKTLFISAVMPAKNADEYAIWLSNKKENVLRSLLYKDSKVNEEWEPTRKLISYFEWQGVNGNITFQNVITEDYKTKVKQGAKLYFFLKDKEFGNKYPAKKNKPQTAAALAYKLSEEGNTLVFCAQVPRIKSVANNLLLLLEELNGDVPNRFKKLKNKQSSYYANIWFGEDSYITKAIKLGIGIHYGDMPEQVRNAIEEDFRNGKLSVLLSTNTIGQGLNFPIKNLIFYSVSIGFNEENNSLINIDNRDFWNIVGRAGRAGKETEGKIVFIINSQSDQRLYNDFINKDHIEDANSLIYKVLEALTESRINNEQFTEYLSSLSETYLLDLLTEEVLGTEYEKIIENIIKNSLFKVQIDKKIIDIEPIKSGFRNIFKSFEKDTTIEQLNAYKVTGFSFKSNKIIDMFIETNITELTEIITNDNYLKFLEKYLELISENEIDELSDYKLDGLNITPIDIINITQDWVSGKPISDLLDDWQALGKEVKDLHIIISKGYNYLYPWALSSFSVILAYKTEIDLKDLPENIKNLNSYIKYGLDNSTSCLARSMGIKNRQVALLLYEESNYLKNANFIKWLSNLSIEEIDSFDIPDFEKENVKTTSLKLTSNSYRNNPESLTFKIKGTFFNKEWCVLSKTVNKHAQLKIKRDIKNQFDPYAILILIEKKPFGYVPREFSKYLSAEIDIEESEYEIHIINIVDKEKYNEIEVEIKKQLSPSWL